MSKKIKTVAFDLGGVLAYQDLSELTEEELFLFYTYKNRNDLKNRKLLEYLKHKMEKIYLKIYRLNKDAISTLEILTQDKVRSSVWTNNTKEIEPWLEENLYMYVKKEDIINSVYLGVNKPNIEFYRKALQLLKNNPNDVLFLDDSRVNILGARICGITGVEYNMDNNLKKTVEKELERVRLK